jgi:hypothetical protein
MSEQLVSPAFLFRFSVPCHYRQRGWGAQGAQLAPQYRLPSFGELEGKKLFADLRVAWNKQGLVLQLRVAGKSQTPWTRTTRAEDSDGLHLWIDTRDTHTIHRASRYCHRFAFLPTGMGSGLRSPDARMVPISRAKEEPKSVMASELHVRSELGSDGYLLEACIPATALTGYDPDEYPRLGFSYAVVDRELGWQTFTVGPELPFQEDPSLWGTLELVRSNS